MCCPTSSRVLGVRTNWRRGYGPRQPCVRSVWSSSGQPQRSPGTSQNGNLREAGTVRRQCRRMATVRGTTGTVLRGKRRHGRRQEASDLLERVRTQHVSPGPQPLRTRQAIGQILHGSLRSPGGSLQPDAVSDRSALQVPYQSSSPWRIDRHLRVGTPQTLRALRLRQSARYDDSRPVSLWCRRRKNPEETTRGTEHNDAQASQHDCDWNGDGLSQHGSAANNSSSFEQRSERARDQAPTGTPRLHVREIKQPVHQAATATERATPDARENDTQQRSRPTAMLAMQCLQPQGI